MYSKLVQATSEAVEQGEVPIACMVKNKKTKDEFVFFNQKEKKNSILGHAEIEAISFLNQIEHDFRLDNWEIIITTDPCIMCLGALIESRISKITILSKKERYELDMLDKYINRTNTLVQYDIQPYFANIIKNFFKNKRNVV